MAYKTTMENGSGVTFNKHLVTIQHILSGEHKNPIVKTRDRLLSFPGVPVEEEGKILWLLSQMALKYVRVRVLNFPDKVKLVAERGEEFQQTHSSLVGKEFYIPLGCPGKLQILRGKRERYATISEVMQDNPRYVLSVSDVAAIPPRDATDTCLTHISAGTTLELKAVKQEKACRYLKCVDKNGGCYFLQEHCPVNFTAVSDSKEYTLRQVRDAGFPLPTPIQFKRGTISPYDVIPFHDAIANNTMVVTAGPLELLEIVTRKVLIANVRDNDNHCFKTLLLPQTMFENFHVQVGEFSDLKMQSIFMERKFGGCLGDNDFIYKKMYLMSTEDKQVCWLRDPLKLTGNVHFYDRRCLDEEQRVLKETILLPTAKIHDQNVLQRIKSICKGKKEAKPETKSKPVEGMTSKASNQKQVNDNLAKSNSVEGTKSKVSNPKQAKKKVIESKSAEGPMTANPSIDVIWAPSPVQGKPLPPLPPEEPLESMIKPNQTKVSNQRQEKKDVTTSNSTEGPMTANKVICLESAPLTPVQGRRLLHLHDYDYIDTKTLILPETTGHKHVTRTARIEQNSFKEQHTKPTYFGSHVQSNPEPQGIYYNSQATIDTNPPITPPEDTVTETSDSDLDDQYYLVPITRRLLPLREDIDTTTLTLPETAGHKHTKPTYITSPVQREPRGVYTSQATIDTNPPVIPPEDTVTETSDIDLYHTKTTSITSPVQRTPELQGAYDNNQEAAALDTPPPLSPAEDTVAETPESGSDCDTVIIPEEVTVQTYRNQSDRDFFTYSVKEAVDCLKTCGMDNLAEMCKTKKLDGEFFQNIELSVLKESFGLSDLDGLKVNKICKGWRPKHT